MIQEFLQYIFGSGNVAEIAATLFYAYVGAFTSLLYQSVKRDPFSPRTPYHFSFSYLWNDNTKRCLRSIILIFIFVRFTKEIFGVNITLYFSFMIGFSIDKLSEYLKQKSNSFFNQ